MSRARTRLVALRGRNVYRAGVWQCPRIFTCGADWACCIDGDQAAETCCKSKKPCMTSRRPSTTVTCYRRNVTCRNQPTKFRYLHRHTSYLLGSIMSTHLFRARPKRTCSTRPNLWVRDLPMPARARSSGSNVETSSGVLMSGKTKPAHPMDSCLYLLPNKRHMPNGKGSTRYLRTSNLRETGRRRNYAHARLAGSVPLSECAAARSPVLAAGPLQPCDCRSADHRSLKQVRAGPSCFCRTQVDPLLRSPALQRPAGSSSVCLLTAVDAGHELCRS